MWAAAPVTEEFKASEDRIKLSRSMSRYISTVYVKCRNGSLKPALEAQPFSRRGAMVGHKLESLILAQNERWRHA